MGRLRKIPSSHCLTCRRTSYDSEAERALVALHRMEHKRLDRRRAQWRAYQARQRKAHDGVDGYLHNLGCKTRHYAARGECVPIPVYRGEE
jgi:hypothetical protein